MRVSRPAALLVALAVVVVSAGAALVGMFWGFGLKCDDSCGSPPPWREDENAWQWSALGWAGIGALACAVLFLVARIGLAGATAAVLAAIALTPARGGSRNPVS